MKIIHVGVLAMLFLTACQSNDIQKSSDIQQIQVHTQDLREDYQVLPMTAQALSGVWQLQDSSLVGSDNQALKLHFDDGVVSVVNGCNNIKAGYRVSSQLSIDRPMSTRMMCDETLMALDNLASGLLGGQVTLYESLSLGQVFLGIQVGNKTYRLTKVSS